jgi:DNA polymerase III epsilon subunit-like protein
MKLFFDTETTGLPVWSEPENSPNHPRMVQLGMVVCEDNGDVVFSLGSIVHVEDPISSAASDIHGITTEISHTRGMPVELLTTLFLKWASECDEIIAHNIKFDRLILTAELSRLGVLFPAKMQYCTMLASTNICKIPKARGYKWPKLSEAYEYFFKEKLVDAHDALVDVMACKRIYFEGLKGNRASDAPMGPPILTPESFKVPIAFIPGTEYVDNKNITL